MNVLKAIFNNRPKYFIQEVSNRTILARSLGLKEKELFPDWRLRL